MSGGNAYLHLPILYGQWEGWDGKPLDQPPLFYIGITESTADLISSMCDEVLETAKLITEKSGADMSEVSSAKKFNYSSIRIQDSLIIVFFRDSLMDETNSIRY